MNAVMSASMAKHITVICRVKGQTVLRLTDCYDSVDDIVLYYSDTEESSLDLSRVKTEPEDHPKDNELEEVSNDFCRTDSPLDPFSEVYPFGSNYHWRGDLNYGSIADYQTMDGYKKYMAIVKSVGRQLFVCKYPNCGYQSMWKNGIVNHIRTTHLSFYPFICGFPGCGKSFAIRSNLNNHRKVHSGRSVLSKSRELADHYSYSQLAVNEKRVLYKNKTSQKTKTGSNEWPKDQNSLESEETKSFETISEPIEKSESVETTEDKVIYKPKVALKSIRESKPSKSTSSSKPKPAFVGIRSVEQYIETTHRSGKTWRKCLWADCGYGTPYTTSIVYHVRNKHLNDKPWVCSFCGKDFAMKTNYNNHMKVHKSKQ